MIDTTFSFNFHCRMIFAKKANSWIFNYVRFLARSRRVFFYMSELNVPWTRSASTSPRRSRMRNDLCSCIISNSCSSINCKSNKRGFLVGWGVEDFFPHLVATFTFMWRRVDTLNSDESFVLITIRGLTRNSFRFIIRESVEMYVKLSAKAHRDRVNWFIGWSHNRVKCDRDEIHASVRTPGAVLPRRVTSFAIFRHWVVDTEGGKNTGITWKYRNTGKHAHTCWLVLHKIWGGFVWNKRGGCLYTHE